MHHHTKRHCRGLEVILARDKLIEREAHEVRARVSVVLHKIARGGGRWHLPQVGACQPRLASVGLRVRAWNLRRIDPVVVAALYTRLRRASLCRGCRALRPGWKPRVLPRRRGGCQLGHAFVRRVNPSLHVSLGRVDLHPHEGCRLWRRRCLPGRRRSARHHRWRPRRRRSAWWRVDWRTVRMRGAGWVRGALGLRCMGDG